MSCTIEANYWQTRMDERRLRSRALYCYIKGRRKRGSPPKKWMDNIKEHVKLVELNIGEAVNLTRGREKWRSLMATTSSGSANGWRKRIRDWQTRSIARPLCDSRATCFCFSLVWWNVKIAWRIVRTGPGPRLIQPTLSYVVNQLYRTPGDKRSKRVWQPTDSWPVCDYHSHPATQRSRYLWHNSCRQHPASTRRPTYTAVESTAAKANLCRCIQYNVLTA